jgi:hypothetical protein
MFLSHKAEHSISSERFSHAKYQFLYVFAGLSRVYVEQLRLTALWYAIGARTVRRKSSRFEVWQKRKLEGSVPV